MKKLYLMKFLKTIILVLISQVSIYSQVIANQPPEYIICDDNNDGFGTFNLVLQTDQIIGAQDPLDLEVLYFVSQSDAYDNISPIPDPEGFVNMAAYLQEIYARVSDVSNLSNFATTNFSIGLINCQDVGEDDDGVSDSDEDLNNNGNLGDDDTDLDGIPNYLDDDDDDDGILTIDEDYNLNGDPTDDDTDNSGVADYLEANVALSVNGLDLDLFKVFPNPALDKLFIQGLSKPTKISVYNVLGRLVLSKITSSEVDVDNLQSGIYIIKIVEEQREVVRKFIIN
jgi:hypothetical protein